MFKGTKTLIRNITKSTDLWLKYNQMAFFVIVTFVAEMLFFQIACYSF